MEPIGTTEVTESVFNNKDIKKWINSCREDISKIEARIYSVIIEDRLSFDKMLNESHIYCWYTKASDINNLVSALQSYRWIINRIANDTINRCINMAHSSCNDLFLEGLFSEWCSSEEDVKDEIVKLYISDIKRVNHDVLCDVGYDILHSFLPDYVKTRNITKINDIFNAIDRNLTKSIDYLTELIDRNIKPDMQRSDIINGRAAMRKYHQFIKSIVFPETEKL